MRLNDSLDLLVFRRPTTARKYAYTAATGLERPASIALAKGWDQQARAREQTALDLRT